MVSLEKERRSRRLILNISFFAGFFTFYYAFSILAIPQAVASSSDIETATIQAGFSLVIALSLVISSLLIKSFQVKLILISSLITAIALLLLLIDNILVSVVSIVIIGFFFAVGQLTSFVYFWRSTEAEQRGRTGGIVGSVSLVFYLLAIYAVAVNVGFSTVIGLCLVTNFVAPAAILILKPGRQTIVSKSQEQYYPEKRVIILYAVPWVLFSLLNATLARNISINTQTLFSPLFIFSMSILQIVAALIGALFGGLVADYIGRRPTLAISMTLYGVSMLLQAILVSEAVFIFKYIAEGMSWGIFLTLYSFVIWGDLSNAKNVAKMYSIGLIVFYATAAIGQLPSILSEIPLIMSALISSVIIFLANLPIVLAPELLPSAVQEKLILKRYIRTVKKVSEKQKD